MIIDLEKIGYTRETAAYIKSKNVEKLSETNSTIESSGCGVGEITNALPTNVAAAKHNKLII